MTVKRALSRVRDAVEVESHRGSHTIKNPNHEHMHLLKLISSLRALH